MIWIKGGVSAVGMISTDLRPNPNAGRTSSSFNFPSSVINLSGLNSSGSGYRSGSWRIALIRKYYEIHPFEYKVAVTTPYHEFPTTIVPGN